MIFGVSIINAAANSINSVNFYRPVQLICISYSCNIAAPGDIEFSFNSFSNTNNPYIASSTLPYDLKKIRVRSWANGINTIPFNVGIVADNIQIQNYSALAVGTAINIYFEIFDYIKLKDVSEFW